jgi:hypothetical protein
LKHRIEFVLLDKIQNVTSLLIQEAEHTFTRLEKLNLTKAQREDAINHLPGHVLEFHRRAAGGFKAANSGM